MELEGILEDIIYQNEINSYLIGVLDTGKEDITIVGYIPFVSQGDNLKVIGKYVEHKEYGTQFKVDTFEKLMPTTSKGLEKYLASGNIKGIGEATAKKIVKKFGENTINIFKFEPEKLAEIKGITREKAFSMAESFLENWEVWQIVGFLEKFGIGAEHAKRVYNLLGVDAIEKIESNPYILIDITRGVEFKQIDEMAMKLGIEYDNEKRVKSGIKYTLIKITNNGHCCVIKENLIEYIVNLLDITRENIENNIINLKMENEIVIEKREDDEEEREWIYLASLYNIEQKIAERLIRLDKSKNKKKVNNIESELKKIEKKTDMILSDKQKEAIEEINENNIIVITGGPGTGKTTIIKNIIEIYESKKYKVVLAAPTGRAAKRMQEATGKEASTLHRLLEIGKIDDENLFQRNAEYQGTPIDADIIVVDEMSMVDMFLMNYLVNSIYIGTKIILVGDVDQLSSVGPGNVLKDIINSEKIKVIKLDKVFRQAAKSKIITNAHRVNKGEWFISKEGQAEDSKEDFFYINEKVQEKVLSEIISLCNGRLKKYGDYDFFSNIQVLTPTKKGMLGTKELNKALQDVLNPKEERKKEKMHGGSVFRVR